MLPPTCAAIPIFQARCHVLCLLFLPPCLRDSVVQHSSAPQTLTASHYNASLACKIGGPFPQYRPTPPGQFGRRAEPSHPPETDDQLPCASSSLPTAVRSPSACSSAATELGLGTVAVYTYEDRFSLHRFKADESYLIGPPEGGSPVKGYLDIPALIAVATEHGVDAIHLGYGFLAENAELARACAANGITFVGPAADLLEAFGDKTAAKPPREEGERPHPARHRARPDRPRRGEEGGQGDRLPGHHQGELRRRRGAACASCRRPTS